MQRKSAPTDAPPPARSTPATILADAAALHAAVSDLVRIYQFRDRDKICCYNISVTQCYALEALAEKGPMRSQALAELLLLDKSTTTPHGRCARSQGLYRPQADAADARAQSLKITGQGRALYGTINREMIAQQAELVADLDPDLRAGVTDVIRRLEPRRCGGKGSQHHGVKWVAETFLGRA